MFVIYASKLYKSGNSLVYDEETDFILINYT
jgi:hypothetical protein